MLTALVFQGILNCVGLSVDAECPGGNDYARSESDAFYGDVVTGFVKAMGGKGLVRKDVGLYVLRFIFSSSLSVFVSRPRNLVINEVSYASKTLGLWWYMVSIPGPSIPSYPLLTYCH